MLCDAEAEVSAKHISSDSWFPFRISQQGDNKRRLGQKRNTNVPFLFASSLVTITPATFHLAKIICSSNRNQYQFFQNSQNQLQRWPDCWIECLFKRLNLSFPVSLQSISIPTTQHSPSQVWAPAPQSLLLTSMAKQQGRIFLSHP